ncbi:MAG TPA: GNAT family N-acetyltransferase [Acidimicrobiales bacterium]|nr:GNAT family N-acetyltransferase [Acidimicrobiales bacterium]
MDQTTGVTISEVDVRNATDDELTRLNTFSNILRKESRPDEPPTPLEVTIAGVRNIPTFIDVWAYIATPDGSDEIIASSQGTVLRTGENEHLFQCGVNVHPEWRRKGLAKALLDPLVEIGEREGKTSLLFNTSARVPAGEEFAKRLGAKAGLVQRSSDLEMANVDRDLIDRWVADGPRRAEGYQMVLFDGPYPTEEYERICQCVNVMNTAPRDDLDVEDMNTTPEQMAEGEKALVAQGVQRWAFFIRHTESGRFVGYTDTYWHPSNPELVNQGGTGVDPGHRGHALGKWLKAAMVAKVLDERPEAKCIRTSNAYSNDAMLGINTEMGFVEKYAETIWQLPVEEARTYLKG